MDLNQRLQKLRESTTTKKSTPKGNKEISLKGKALTQKENSILKAIAEIENKKHNKYSFDISGIFYKGMKYQDSNGVEKIATSDGFRFIKKDINGNPKLTESGTQKIGVWFLK